MAAHPSPVIVFEDNHVLVVNKPVLLATMGTAAGARSLARDLQAELKRKYRKPGNVYLGIVSRLDTVTSGLIVFAKTSKAAGRLTTQFQHRQVDKWYLAAVPSVPSRWVNSADGAATPPLRAPADAAGPAGPEPVRPAAWPLISQHFDGRWLDRLWKDDQAHRMRCEVGAAESDGALVGGEQTGAPGAAGRVSAGLEWRFLGRGPDYDLVVVRLLTGRKHQIRVQFAARGLPILGDRKYGSPASFPAGIALHSWRLAFTHPVTRQPLSFAQGPPPEWRSLASCRPTADLWTILGDRCRARPAAKPSPGPNLALGPAVAPGSAVTQVSTATPLNPAELIRWLMETESQGQG